MTKTLEFIEKEIKRTKKSCDAFKLDYSLFGRQSDKNDYIKLEKKLCYLHQIKTELKAWEEIKKRLIREKYSIFHSKDCSVHNYTRIYLKEIKEDENTEEYQILKKALEVKDEKEN